MIILATAIILALNSSNITNKASWAKLSSDRANLQAEYATILANVMTEKDGGKAATVTVADVTASDEYKVWADKVKAAGFIVEVPTDNNNPAGIRVVLKLSETTLPAYDLQYDETKNEVKGYDWVKVEKEQVQGDNVKVDGVTIPEGFVASIYDGEMTKAEGLVIYETDSLEGIDQETAMTSYNQFVWVPVEDFSSFQRTQGYFPTLEPVYSVCLEYNYDTGYYQCTNTVDLSSSSDSDLTGEHAEYAEMRKSVEENKGFYIGRYEAGTPETRYAWEDNGTTTVLIQKGKPVYNYVHWGPSMSDVEGEIQDTLYNANLGKGAVELSRNLYEDSASVVSTLCYGVQWDAALKFISTTDSAYATDSRNKGNYNTANAANTGSNDNYAVNNIYDMAGNVEEWTMEADAEIMPPYKRVIRGGNAYEDGLNRPATCQTSKQPTYNNEYLDTLGFRVALYLK